MKQRIRSAGQALVEFTFAAVLIFFLLAAAVDLGMIFFTMQSLHSAAQEGALYGSMMFYDDVNDEDEDGIRKRDPYYNPSEVGGRPISQTEALENDLWYFYEDYYQGIRERAVYEAGHEGGSGFSNLHDLNSDGRRDTWEEIRDNQWVDVFVFRHVPGGGTEPCGDPYIDNGCKIRVTVRSRYKLFFPLAPAFTDHIWLQSSYVVDMNESGFAKAPNTDPGVYVPLETETPTPTATEEPATPTPTPNPYCVTKFKTRGVDPAAVDEPWESAFVPERVQGDGDTDGATEDGASKVELCSSGLGIEAAASTDDFYYVYAQREGSDARFVSFSAKVTNWSLEGSANDGTSAGLMIRKDKDTHHPYALVAYVPSRNQVVFQIRTDESVAAVPAWRDLPLNFEPSESTPLWLRLERTNSMIAASYKATEAGEWQYLPHGPSNWVKVDLYQSYALFGMAQSSGTDTEFALSTFKDVQIIPDPGTQLEVVFIEPEDGTELVSYDGNDTSPERHTNFEIELVPETTDTFQVEKVVYTLLSPNGAVDLDGMPHTWTREGGTMTCNQSGCNPSFMLCPFGGEAGSCDSMPESTYESLQARGDNNNYYIIRAEVYVEDEPDPRVFGGQSRFFINRPQIEFHTPPNDEYVWQAGDTGDVGVRAWDRKYGRMVGNNGTNGIGLTAMEYAMVFYPTLPAGYVEEARGSLCASQPRYCEERLYETDYDRTIENGYSLDDLVCMFGSHEDGTCREMSAEDGGLRDPENRLPEYEELRAGEYFLAARALPTLPNEMKPGEDGFDESLWTEWAWRQRVVVPPIEFRFSHEGGSWETEEVPVVNRDNTSALKVEVNAPHVGPDNGDGLDFVRVELYKRNGAQIVPVTSLNLSPEVDVQALDPMLDFFCIFAGTAEDGADCPMADTEPFYNLEGGRYILRVLATNKASDLHAWVEDERELQIDTAPIARRFVDQDDDFLTEDGSRSVTGMDDTIVRLVAHIDEADAGIDLGKNGEGVYQVEFQLFEEETAIPFPAGQAATTYILKTEDVASSPFYCPFGFDGSACRPISYGDDGDFHSLKSKTKYTLWAVPKRQIEGELQSGNPLGFTFVIPEMKIAFRDGAPEFNEAIKELEETRFELEAHDPRYGSTENGAGIAAFGFEMCHEGGSCIEKTYGIDMVDGNLRFVEDADPNEEAYTASYDDGYGGSRPSLCLFGQEDGSTDCQTMEEEAFRNLRSGNYTIDAWVRNWGGVEVQETDWKFSIESSIEIEFIEPDEVQTIEDRDETRFEVKAYDIRVGEENGAGIDRVEFKIIEQNLPADETTIIFESEYDAEDDGDPREDAFCIFDPASDDDECDDMDEDLYDELTTGDYLIRVRAIRDLGDGEEEWEEDELTFEIPEMPIDVYFVDNTLTQDEPITITNRSETAFRARAFRAREEVEDNGTDEPTDGQGISNVKFTIRDPEGDKVLETSEEEAPFCAFGDTDGTCNEMPTDRYSSLSAGEYTIEAKATAFNEDTETTETVRFIIPPPPITLTFWYPEASGGLNDSDRVTDGLLALYTFEEGSGEVVEDVSGVGTPLNLTIEDTSKVEWLPGRGLRVNQKANPSDPRNSSTIIKSDTTADKIVEAIGGDDGSEELTIEAWIRPTDLGRDGPARIVTLSEDTGNKRNFTFGQGLWGGAPTDLYDVRLVTTRNRGGTDPSVVTRRGTVTEDLTHVVYTVDANGNAGMYLDGQFVEIARAQGNSVPRENQGGRWRDSQDVTKGNDHIKKAWGNYHLALGNEVSFKTDNPPARFWRGEYYLVAVYGRVLTADEVEQNYSYPVMVEAPSGTVLEINDRAQTAFEVQAFQNDIPSPSNGDGIGKVQFELSGPGGQQFTLTNPEDTTTPYCPSGDSPSDVYPCNPLSQEIFGSLLVNNQYVLRARAQEYSGNQRWTAWEELRFTLKLTP